MLRFLLLALLPFWVQTAIAQTTDGGSGGGTPLTTCHAIAASISSASEVFYPGSTEYDSDNHHYVLSSFQNSTCSVEPGTSADVATIIKIIGHNRTPFAVKCGGHETNQGFSSTTGVQIALVRLNSMVYDATAKTVTVGSGLIWDQVYAYLEQYDVNVVGGRVAGIGISGFLTGGGYSWLTNQYGLGLDNIVSAELVLPNGTEITVSQSSHPDIFFGIKGGYNNFGIITSWVLNTYPQGEVWGGIRYIAGTYTDDVLAAVSNFTETSTDPKAQLIATVAYQGGVLTYVELFYDAPNPPPGLFDALLDIPYEYSDVETRTFANLITASPDSSGLHGVYNGVSLLKFPLSILNVIANQTEYWGSKTANQTGTIGYSIEPFLPNIFNHNTHGDSAYPPERAFSISPVNLEFFWTDPTQGASIIQASREAHDYLIVQAALLGQPEVLIAPLYPNYALNDTLLVEMYGINVPFLHALKWVVDPYNVMGLTGGFKF